MLTKYAKLPKQKETEMIWWNTKEVKKTRHELDCEFGPRGELYISPKWVVFVIWAILTGGREFLDYFVQPKQLIKITGKGAASQITQT